MEELNLNEDRIYAVLEPLRKKQYVWMGITILPVLVGFLCACVFSLMPESPLLPLAGLMPFLGFGGAFAIGWKASDFKKEYVMAYKGMVSKQVLKACFKDAKYEPEKGITRREFEETKLISINSQHKFNSEDLITGTYEGVQFKQSDVEVYHYVKRGKHRRRVTDVNGRVCSFSFEKDIVGDILIVKDSSKTIRPQKGMKKIEMEDVDFNNKFDVFSYDGHSVFYLLTPHFMEYIKKLHGKASSLYISFDGRNLHILWSGRGGIFEPPDSKKIDVKAEINKSYRQLHEIVELIDVFKLDEKVKEEEMIQSKQEAVAAMEEISEVKKDTHLEKETESKFNFKLKM